MKAQVQKVFYKWKNSSTSAHFYFTQVQTIGREISSQLHPFNIWTARIQTTANSNSWALLLSQISPKF